jgi:proteic killer suppression protein
MIKSFKDKETERIFKGMRSKRLPLDIQTRAFVKLHSIDVSSNINDLRNPPSNHLEVLIGDRNGQYSIKINQQWRVCFNWDNSDAYNVEIVDYH